MFTNISVQAGDGEVRVRTILRAIEMMEEAVNLQHLHRSRSTGVASGGN